jgi:hypothetical protein
MPSTRSVGGFICEVCFPFHPSRSYDYVGTALGLTQAPGSVLLTDGYAAYQALYAVEQDIRDQNLTGNAKQLHRLTHSKSKVEVFFDWVDRQLERQGFTPTHPFIQALVYAKTRRLGLEVLVTDPDVPIDTNHLERTLRIAYGLARQDQDASG